METDTAPAAATARDLRETSEDVDFRLTAIVRKRRRPLLLVMDAAGELVSSSLPAEATAAEQRLLGQALAEAKHLCQSQFWAADMVNTVVVDRPGQRCALVMLDGAFFSVRLFPLHPALDDRRHGQCAVLIEPIVEPSVEGIDFAKLKSAYRLSKRELDVLGALMSGGTDKQIAHAVGVSAGTVRAYLKSVRAKLGVTTRAAVVNLVHQFAGEGGSATNK